MSTYLNIFIEKGTTFKKYLTIRYANNAIKNVNGHSFEATMKRSYQSANSVPLVITIENANTGNVSINLSDTASANLAAARYVYDINSTIANTITREFEGIATLTPNVTN
jgi:hypothetical protein